jgi:hypothetical protein
MMCRSCVTAGEEKVLGNFEHAKLMHEDCQYPKSCTCQHYVEKSKASEE